LGNKPADRADRSRTSTLGSVGPSTHTASHGDWWEANRALLIRECVSRPHAARELLLDVGCGSGYALSDQAGLDARLKVGIDAWRSSEWDTAGGAVFVVADVSKLPFRSGVADVVLTLDVIEHLDDDQAALAEAARVLRVGGRAAVMVPAFAILWSPHDDTVGHYRRYRLADLVGPLSSAGLRIVQRSYFYSWLFPVALVRRVLHLGGQSDTTPRALGPIAHMIGRLERLVLRHRVPIPFGTSAFVEAVRDDMERDECPAMTC
jgi:SAM-dependent methyltransferase